MMTQGEQQAGAVAKAAQKLAVARRVDWFRLLVELDRAGLPLAAVAVCTGVPRTTMMSWKNQGCEPRHADGERVLGLWAEATGKGREELPYVAVAPTGAGRRGAF